MKPEQCRIILVRPRDPNNIGAAARAMKNFGLRDLVVVSPHPPVWAEVKSAVGAADIIARARVVATIAEAVADCTRVVGTGDHTRFKKQQTIFTPVMLREAMTAGTVRTGLLFGPEKNGLTNEDLSFCHQVVSIPTAPGCPSMNLGQAVAICCYELTREQASEDLPSAAREIDAASAGEIEELLRLAVEAMLVAEYLNSQNAPAKTEEFRQILLRLQLTRREVNLFRGVMRQLERKLRNSSFLCD